MRCPFQSLANRDMVHHVSSLSTRRTTSTFGCIFVFLCWSWYFQWQVLFCVRGIWRLLKLSIMTSHPVCQLYVFLCVVLSNFCNKVSQYEKYIVDLYLVHSQSNNASFSWSFLYTGLSNFDSTSQFLYLISSHGVCKVDSGLGLLTVFGDGGCSERHGVRRVDTGLGMLAVLGDGGCSERHGVRRVDPGLGMLAVLGDGGCSERHGVRRVDPGLGMLAVLGDGGCSERHGVRRVDPGLGMLAVLGDGGCSERHGVRRVDPGLGMLAVLGDGGCSERHGVRRVDPGLGMLAVLGDGGCSERHGVRRVDPGLGMLAVLGDGGCSERHGVRRVDPGLGMLAVLGDGGCSERHGVRRVDPGLGMLAVLGDGGCSERLCGGCEWFFVRCCACCHGILCWLWKVTSMLRSYEGFVVTLAGVVSNVVDCRGCLGSILAPEGYKCVASRFVVVTVVMKGLRWLWRLYFVVT